MKLITVKAKKTRFSKEIYHLQLKAYDVEDFLKDDLIRKRKFGFDHILRKRLTHINTQETGRAKTKVILGMVKLIYRYMFKIYMRELIAGSDIQLGKIGFFRIKTFKFNNNYRGYSVERQRQKLANRYDMPLFIDCRKVDASKKISYYYTFHGKTKQRYNEAVKKGMIYNDK